MNIDHPIINTDSYKLSHFLQYPPDTKYISSYIEARGSKVEGVDQVMFFGLKKFIDDIMTIRVTNKDIDYAEELVRSHGLPFNREGWEIIVNDHGGYLPLFIQAVPEGSVLPVGTPLVQITNTDPRLAWLVSYIETAILRAVWYPTTVASMSFNDLKMIRKYYETTVGSIEGVEFMKHDFGARGVSSNESAGIGGLAHLASGFMGTDTIAAIEYGRQYYSDDMAGYSVFATEHSTTTVNGEEGELAFFERMIDYGLKNPGAIVSMVSDSYNIWRAVDDYIGTELHDKIVALGEVGSRLVVRPDSGDPVAVPVEVVERLASKFGTTKNSLGYKVLPDYIRVIQGDGINSSQMEEILRRLKDAGYASSNIVFGMGGGLLQKVDRDTFKFAMKANAICFDGETWVPVRKEPLEGGKGSKPGRIEHVFSDGTHRTTEAFDAFTILNDNILKGVYISKNDFTETYGKSDGLWNTVPTLANVRAQAARAL